MTNTQTSLQTTMNRAKPADDQPTQENEVAHEATYGRMPAEWARTVATLSAVTASCLPAANGSSAIKWNWLRTLRGTSWPIRRVTGCSARLGALSPMELS
jgi:hypothetical protein